jgi:hypothetical protein
MRLFETIERRDPAEVLPTALPEPILHGSHREFIRRVLSDEVDLRAQGTGLIDRREELPSSPSARYRERLNRAGSPSEIAAAGYQWFPGSELIVRATAADALAKGGMQ